MISGWIPDIKKAGYPVQPLTVFVTCESLEEPEGRHLRHGVPAQEQDQPEEMSSWTALTWQRGMKTAFQTEYIEEQVEIFFMKLLNNKSDGR